jgi:DUF4097 and DUF4098 domain-containing protein YvlB
MPRKLLTAAAVALSLAAASPAHAFQKSGPSPFDWSGSMKSGAQLTIRNFNGRIEVHAGTGSQVTVHAEATGSRRSSDLTFEARQDGGDVSVCSVWRGRSACDNRGGDWDDDDHDGRDMRATITVTLPKGVALRGGTGNGDVTVDGTGGDINIATGNGDVRVSGTAGMVKVSSGNGDLDVSGAEGTVSASTGNGRVRVTTGKGPVSASTGNGDITVDMKSIANADDMKFTTGHGDIDVTVPASINMEFDATTGWGSIRTDFPIRVQGSLNPRHIEGTIGRGGQRLRMSTGFGSIELRKAN